MTERKKTTNNFVLVALDIAKKLHRPVVQMLNGKRFYTKVANSYVGY